MIKGKVTFLTPVPYYSSPELRKKGLVIVDLEQLQNAQKDLETSSKEAEEKIIEKIEKAKEKFAMDSIGINKEGWVEGVLDGFDMSLSVSELKSKHETNI